MSLLDKIDTKRLPQHVAIIMAGNDAGQKRAVRNVMWAIKKGLFLSVKWWKPHRI